MKTRFALLITAALLAIGLPIPAHAATPFTYTVSGGNATITGYNGTPPTNLVIPDEITDGNGTYPVTTIGISAFDSSLLTELTLPNTLTTIRDFAFFYNQLTELTLPSTLTLIGTYAFDLNQLRTVRFTGAAPQVRVNALGISNPPLTVRFPWRLGEPRAVGGYTTPTWNGHTTVPVADVTFTGGGTIDAQLVDVDGTSTATKPADPVKAGNRFTGWFTGGATTPFDFTTPITGDTVLTAGFEPAVAPILSGPATTSATLGAEVTWEPTTLTADPAATVTATGLPAGLTIDDTTGVISGKVTDPSLAGDHPVTITASNGVDPAATHTLTISIEYFTYSVSGGDATITGYHGTTPTNLVIADEITDSNGTYPVTAIGDSAFFRKQLTDLTLPDTLTTIGRGAFQDNELTKLTFPNTLTTIDEWAFYNNQLTEVTLPNSLTTIGTAAFYTNLLTELTLPDTLTTIDTYAFFENTLATVRFTGAAPQLGAHALSSTTTPLPTVRFPWRLGEPRAVGGYTTPTWNGYTTVPVADVTFTGGGTIDAQLVDVDGTSTASKPADPVKAGHVFTGWFTGGATTPFDFSTPITGDTALTARFELPPVSPEPGPAPAPGPSPVVTGLDPAITGTVREGKTLRAKPGTITPAGTAVAYQWRADGKTIKGATKSWLPLRKAQAGKRITVTITAKTTGAPVVTKTSAKTKPVSSAKRRLVLSTYRVGKNKPVTVTATGFSARQKVIIWLGGTNRYVGRADSRGVITKTVTFAEGIKPGLRRVRVSGYASDGDRNRTIVTTVRYR